jgi:hypothetical protein
MIARSGLVTLLLLCMFTVGLTDEPLTTDQILQNILHKAEDNEKLIDHYGFTFESTEKKLAEDGSVKTEQTKSYRIIWIQNETFAELTEVDGKPLNDKQQKEEQKRRQEFEKKLKQPKKKDPEEEEFEWKDLYEKYDFTRMDPTESSAYTMAFEPKRTRLREKNRTEKVLNHLRGTFWADQDFNILKVTANLESPIRFGLGILAKIDRLEIEYSQRRFENIFVPSRIRYNFAGRIAVVHSERREQIIEFHEYYSHRE